MPKNSVNSSTGRDGAPGGKDEVGMCPCAPKSPCTGESSCDCKPSCTAGCCEPMKKCCEPEKASCCGQGEQNCCDLSAIFRAVGLCGCESPKKVGAGKGARGPLLGSVGVLRITVKIDVGLGNWLTIRGCGGGLGWDKGVPLKNMGPDVWVWETCTYDDVEFKLLINDAHWECGDNHRCSGGESVTVTPLF